MVVFPIPMVAVPTKVNPLYRPALFYRSSIILQILVAYDITTAVLGAPNPWEVITTLQTLFMGSHTGLGLGNSI